MLRRWLPVAALYVGLLVLGWAISDRVSALIADKSGSDDMIWMMVLVCSLYMLASAIPFVPGAEIGLGLIAVFGVRVVALVYLCMVFALCLSFVVGRLVPAPWLTRAFQYLKMHKAANLVSEIAELPPHACEERLRARTNNRFLLALLGHRYLAMAVAINLPGNTVLGGGGGLALFAGMSRLFSPFWFLVTLLVAVAPIPLTVFFMGYQP